MGRSRLFVRNPSLCVLPCQREEHGAMSPPVGREQEERPQLRRRLAGRFTDYGWLLEAWQTCAGDTGAEVRAATDGVRSRGRFPLVGLGRLRSRARARKEDGLGGGVRTQHGLRPQRDRAARARPLPASASACPNRFAKRRAVRLARRLASQYRIVTITAGWGMRRASA